jgi:hypothetical protein
MSQMPRRSFPNDTRIGKALGGGVLVTVGAWIAGESSLADHSLRINHWDGPSGSFLQRGT